MVYLKMKLFKVNNIYKSPIKHKKYRVALVHKNGTVKTMDFGDKRYEHYRDKTNVKLYKYLDHNDRVRRKRYIARHKMHIKKGYYSPSYFSMKYLW
mgnify:CR=1 FL=1